MYVLRAEPVRLTVDYIVRISVWKFIYVSGDINTAKGFSMDKKIIISVLFACFILLQPSNLLFAQTSNNELLGTWAMVEEGGTVVTVKFETGSFEVTLYIENSFHGFLRRGIITIRGNTLIQTTTHLHGDFLNLILNTSRFNSRWYAQTEIVSLIPSQMNEDFFKTWTSTYSINRNTLTLTTANGMETFTRQ